MLQEFRGWSNKRHVFLLCKEIDPKGEARVVIILSWYRGNAIYEIFVDSIQSTKQHIPKLFTIGTVQYLEQILRYSGSTINNND